MEETRLEGRLRLLTVKMQPMGVREWQRLRQEQQQQMLMVPP